MIRKIETIEYELTFKKIKNVNLRISPDNKIKVSAPYRTDTKFIDDFVRSRKAFIETAIKRNEARTEIGSVPAADAEVYRKLYEIYRDVYPLFSEYSFRLPTLKIREMKSQWGNCRKAQRLITLNKRLYTLPRRLIEFVCAHELAHMVEANHSAVFYAVLTEIMPDWQARESEIRQYRTV